MNLKKFRNPAQNSIFFLTLQWSLIVLIGIYRVPQISGDTVALAQGSQSLFACAKNFQFHGCSGTHQFGILQNIPAIFLAWKGLSDNDTVIALGVFNLAVFICVSIWIYKDLSNFPNRNLFCVVMLAGPLAPYVQSTFAEMLQVAVYLLLGISILKSRIIWTALFALLATSTRETAFLPLIFVCLALATYIHFHDLKQLMKWYLGICISVLSGIILLLLFNEWKFATWKNLPHSDPVLIVSDWETRFSSLIGIWIAPGGGLVTFWFLVGMSVLVFPLYGLFKKSMMELRISSLLVLLALGAATASLAIWYAPFGWVAWGPRLMLPIGALSFLVVWRISNNEIRQGIKWIEQRPFFKSLLVSIAIISIAPSIGFQSYPDAANRFYSGDTYCGRPAIIQQDPTYYFRCLRHGTWKLDPSLWSSGFSGFKGMWPWILLLVTFCALWFTLRSNVIVQSENHHIL